jgi:UDP-glucose:(heptosyl)LPS alpha-1,3-glucosyltransferase
VRTATRAGYDIVHAIGGCLPGANVITAQFCHAEWRKVAPEMSWYQRLVTRQAISDERRAYSDPGLRAVIAVSHRTAEEVQRHYGPLRVPIHAIPNGVDLQRFSPRPTPHSPHTPRLLLVGALDRKGLATAVRALAQMTTSCELLAIGDGDHQHYRDLASRAGVSDRVRIEPPRSDIAAAFALADAFVLPTRYEPFGMVIAEALASGVPVVTTRRAGAAELIREGVNGFTVEDPDDAAGFAAALDRIVGSTPERQESVAAAAREAVADLGWDRVAQRVLEVYRGLG